MSCSYPDCARNDNGACFPGTGNRLCEVHKIDWNFIRDQIDTQTRVVLALGGSVDAADLRSMQDRRMVYLALAGFKVRGVV
jgi:hypothetical protein